MNVFAKQGVLVAQRDWEAYEKVRASGKYNMVTDALDVVYETKIRPDVYRCILQNYNELKNHTW